MAAFRDWPFLFPCSVALLFVLTCGPSSRDSSQLTLSLSADSVRLSPGQTVDIAVTLKTTVPLDELAVMSLRSPGDQPLPEGLNAAFDPTTLAPIPDREASAKLHVLAQTALSNDSYPLLVYARTRSSEASTPLMVSVVGNGSNWRRPISTLGTEQVMALAGDLGDGVYVAVNTTSGFADLGNQGGFDGYVLHYRGNGAVSFVRPLATSGSDVITALAADPAGGVYAAGFTYGTFPGQTSMGKADAFLAKLGTDGSLAWLQQLGTAEIDQLTGVAVGPDGAVYVTGLSEGAFPGQSNAGGTDVFVARFFSDGRRDWISEFGSAFDERTNGVSNQAGAGVTVDANNNVYVCGSTLGSLAGATSQGMGDAFVARFRADGTQAWLKQIGSYADDALVAIATHPSGMVYAAGWARGPIPGQVQMGGQDALVVAYTSDGTQAMVRQFGTSYADVLNAISIVGDRIYVAGTTRGAFPGQTQEGVQDIFFTRLASDGSILWLRQIGTSQSDSGTAITASSGQGGAMMNLYLGGTSFGDWTTDAALTESDGFLNQYPAD